MIQTREVRGYFRLKTLAKELYRFFHDHNDKAVGSGLCEKIKDSGIYETAGEIEDKADELFAADVARSYYSRTIYARKASAKRRKRSRKHAKGHKRR